MKYFSRNQAYVVDGKCAKVSTVQNRKQATKYSLAYAYTYKIVIKL